MARFGRRYIPWKERKPPGSLATTAAIAGSCDIAFANSGTVAGAGALVGACAVELVSIGTMTAGSLISGTCALTITPSGTLVGAGALAGSCAMVITGTLDSGVAPAELPPNAWYTLGENQPHYTLPVAPQFSMETR